MPGKEEVIVVNELEQQNHDMNEIANEARKEIGLDAPGANKNVEEGEEDAAKAPEGETEEQKIAREKEEETATAKEAEEVKKKEDEKKKEEEDRLLAAEEKDLKDEEKYRKIKILESRNDEKKKQGEVVIKTYSEKHGVSIDDARKDIESITKIVEKYKGDSKELAQAYLHIQRAQVIAQTELARQKDAAPIKSIEKLTDDDIIKDIIDAGQITIDNKPASREQLIDRYRSLNLKQTEDVEDEKVIYMLSKDLRQAMISQKVALIQQIKIKAKEKRAEIIGSLPEQDKEFAENVKAVVEHSPDEQVISESFSVQDIVRWAKGEKYDQMIASRAEDVKKAHDEGYRKGKEEAKILGLKVSTPPKSPTRPSNATLSEAQKKEALDMFVTVSASDEEKYKLYLDSVPESRRAK